MPELWVFRFLAKERGGKSTMNIKEVAAKYADYQIEMRRYFHKHP